MKVLSVVCARAGSKGLKNKCIAKMENRMLIEYSIDYSLSLGPDVKTVVSTDIDRVIDYCKQRNIEYIKREPQLCTDEIKIDGVLADAIEKKGKECKYTSIVYANIPIRYPRIFHKALAFLQDHKDYDAVISMQNVEKFHPHWMFDYNEETLPGERRCSHKRQLLPQKMIHDGHTLLFKNKDFYERFKKPISYDCKNLYSVFGDKIKPLINDELIIDVDTNKDLKLAETVLMCRKDKKNSRTVKSPC